MTIKKEALVKFFSDKQWAKEHGLTLGGNGTDVVARTAHIDRFTRSVISYAKDLLWAGEPIKALEVLKSAPSLVAHEKDILEMRKQLEESLLHASSFDAFKRLYTGFHTSTPGGSALKDVNLLSMDRYYHMAACLSAINRKSVLNIGAGDGIVDLAMMSILPGIEKWCIADFAPNCKDVVDALREEINGVEITGHDVDSHLFDWPDAEFDVVIASEVIEHVPDQAALLAEAANKLKKDGHLILTTPDASFWVYTPHEILHHITTSTPKTLSEAMEKAGFEVVHCSVSDEQHTVIMGKKK